MLRLLLKLIKIIQVILILLRGEFAYCVPPSPSLGVLRLEWRVEGSWQRSPKWRPNGQVTLSGCTRLIHQLLSWMSGVLPSLLLTLQSTVIHLCLWQHGLWWTGGNVKYLLRSVESILNLSRLVEMLDSCHCMQLCALPGKQASSQLTERGALFSLSGKGRVIARTATSTKGWCCGQCWAKSLLN